VNAEPERPRDRRLRLVKVLVQPVFVIEEPDGSLSEPDQEVSRLAVKSVDWPRYATEIFPRHVEQLEEQLFDQPRSSV
jgi:hypothetical protein